MKRLIILLVSASFLLLSCSKDHDEDTVFIRIYNQSDKQLYDVSYFSNVEKNYGDVPPQHATPYKPHEDVDNVPFCKFTMAGYPTWDLLPRCFTGYLSPGKYTLLVWEEDSHPMVRLVND